MKFDGESGFFEGIHEETPSAVRREQISLAAYFLSKGDEARARRIHEDMQAENRDRLAAVRESI